MYSQRRTNNIPERGILNSPWPTLDVIPEGNYVDLILNDWEKYSERIAIINSATDEKFTYSDVVKFKRNIASGLVRRGTKPGFMACLVAPNCPEFILTMCGVLAAGGTLTTANPIASADEMAKQWIDAKPEYIITHIFLAETVKSAAAMAKCVKDIYVIGGNADGCHPFSDLLEDDGGADPSGQLTVNAKKDLAFLPYSSGTTGLPKGVMITHHNLAVNLLQGRRALNSFVDEDNTIYLGLLPFFHIYGLVVTIGMALNSKSTIVTMPKFDPKTFLETVTKYKMNVLHLVPPLVHFLVHHPKLEDYDLSNVVLVTSAAAPLDKNTERIINEKLMKINPNIDFLQGYGLSENVVVSIQPLRTERTKNKEASVGRVVSNVTVKFVDPESGNEVNHSGEIGEIYVKGEGVFQGYFNKPDSYNDTFKDGWLITGDMGYFDEDEYIYIVDRRKELIKYNAYQVPPAELEGVIREHPAVLDCAVIGKPDAKVGELPTAFVVTKMDVTEKEIQDFVAGKVSNYKKLRGGVIFIKQIPKTASGKILRRELKILLPES